MLGSRKTPEYYPYRISALVVLTTSGGVFSPQLNLANNRLSNVVARDLRGPAMGSQSARCGSSSSHQVAWQDAWIGPEMTLAKSPKARTVAIAIFANIMVYEESMLDEVPKNCRLPAEVDRRSVSCSNDENVQIFCT